MVVLYFFILFGMVTICSSKKSSMNILQNIYFCVPQKEQNSDTYGDDYSE